MPQSIHTKEIRMAEWVAHYRQYNPAADRWAAGYGRIQHTLETQARVITMAEALAVRGVRGDGVPLFEVLYAADRVASAAMWLVVHETYARNVYVDGRDQAPEDFKPHPEGRLQAATEAVRAGNDGYPIRLPYGVAQAPKGAGFYGEGTNLAHNLPLPGNPHSDPVAAHLFNDSARRLWVPLRELREAVGTFQHHGSSNRPKERDHPLVHREVSLRELPPLVSRPVPQDRRDHTQWTRSSAMFAVDATFTALVQANPHLRPRVGNPDELRSNRLLRTLDALRFRVTDPEPDIPEAIDGAVITALNEEAVASAALANKGGINLIHTYEALGTKMHGILRQEVIFTNHCQEAGRRQGWLSVPLILTSHTWENARNELSHQDPSMAEAMLSELSDVSRVVFIPDYNTAAVAMQRVYKTHGQFWTMVVPKAEVIPELFTTAEAEQLLEQGALRLEWAGYNSTSPRLILTAIGAYQLEEVLRASARLVERQVPHAVNYMLEPGRLRRPRSAGEQPHAAPTQLVTALYPETTPLRLFVSHTRPEVLLGVLQPLHTGYHTTSALGFIGQGGTLTVAGMLTGAGGQHKLG